MKLLQIIKTLLLSTVFVWGTGCVSIQNEYPLRIKVGTDDMGHTYSIVDSATDSLIYDGGHNEITLSSVWIIRMQVPRRQLDVNSLKCWTVILTRYGK